MASRGSSNPDATTTQSDAEDGGEQATPTMMPNPPPLCRRFLVHGRCWGDPADGGDCPFAHVLPDGKTLEQVRSETTCPFLGRCKYVGIGKCLFSHDGDPYPHRTPKEQKTREPGQKSKKKMEKEMAKVENQPKHGSDEEGGEPCCGICLEVPPLSKGDAKAWARYALLPGCDHVFCIKCIRQWRAANKSVDDNAAGETTLDKALVKCCPTCRSPSRFCVPSDKYLKGESKDRAILHFKDSKAKKVCRSYKVGQLGSCPFGSECFYLHPDHCGNDMKMQDQKAEVLFSQRQEVYLERRSRRRRLRMGIDVAEAETDIIREFMGLLSMVGEAVGEAMSDEDRRDMAMAIEGLLPPLPPSARNQHRDR